MTTPASDAFEGHPAFGVLARLVADHEELQATRRVGFTREQSPAFTAALAVDVGPAGSLVLEQLVLGGDDAHLGGGAGAVGLTGTDSGAQDPHERVVLALGRGAVVLDPVRQAVVVELLGGGSDPWVPARDDPHRRHVRNLRHRDAPRQTWRGGSRT